MKERGTAHTWREPPACPAFCNMLPKSPNFSHVPPSQGPYPKNNFSKPIIKSPTPKPSVLAGLHVSSMCAGFKTLYNAYMMHTAQGGDHASTGVGAPKPPCLPSSKSTRAHVTCLGSLVLCQQPCMGRRGMQLPHALTTPTPKISTLPKLVPWAPIIIWRALTKFCAPTKSGGLRT